MARYRYRVEAIVIPPEGAVLDRKILLTFPGEQMGNPEHHILLCLTEEEIVAPAGSRSKSAGRAGAQRAGGGPADAESPG